MSEAGHSGLEHGPAMQYTVPELAKLLGISRQAVLAQIARGDLLAIDTESGWIIYVDLPEAPSSPPATAQERSELPSTDEVVAETYAPDPPAERVEAPLPEPALPMPVAVPVSPVDLTLLINLVSDLTRRNAELLDSTATWRARVQELEQQLLQLSPGELSNPVNSGSQGNGTNEITGPTDVTEANSDAECASLAPAIDPALVAALFRGPAADPAPGQPEPNSHPPARPWWKRLTRQR
jgi:hypothetical protein